jgi:hypothetical protein
MTLEPYDSTRLDALALRLLDLCGRVRSMSHATRDTQLPTVELHDRKALEWIEKLEEWMVAAEAQLHRQAGVAAGTRAAREAAKKAPGRAR